MNIEFDFIDLKNNPVENIKDAAGMIAYFTCFNLRCGTRLFVSKNYKPAPEHYQSLLQLCKPVVCPKCKTQYQHTRDADGEDKVEMVEGNYNDPNQLSLF